MAATLAEIAYNDAVRALDGQRQLIADLRTRAAVVVSAGVLIAAFLAEPVLTEGRPTAWVWPALVSTIAEGLCALSVLWPRSLEAHHVEATEMLRLWRGKGSPGAYQYLAGYLDEAYNADNDLLNGTAWYDPGLFRLFQAANVLLLLEVALWVVALWRT